MTLKYTTALLAALCFLFANSVASAAIYLDVGDVTVNASLLPTSVSLPIYVVSDDPALMLRGFDINMDVGGGTEHPTSQNTQWPGPILPPGISYPVDINVNPWTDNSETNVQPGDTIGWDPSAMGNAARTGFPMSDVFLIGDVGSGTNLQVKTSSGPDFDRKVLLNVIFNVDATANTVTRFSLPEELGGDFPSLNFLPTANTSERGASLPGSITIVVPEPMVASGLIAFLCFFAVGHYRLRNKA